jgi:glycosyltransferase involved in cell wall biosynthesis
MNTTNDTIPGRVVDVELTEPLPTLTAAGPDGRAERVWVVARVAGQPVAMTTLEWVDDQVLPDRLHDALVEAGAPCGDEVAVIEDSALARRRRIGDEVPLQVTVVVCTRDRDVELRRCLASLQRQRYPGTTILVVDNAPTTDVVQRVVADSVGPHEVTYLCEPVAGLSAARNAALGVATGDVVAWIDDDEEADEYWVTEFVAAFVDDSDTSAVSGLVLPAELRTPSQLWFETYGGLSKGRGTKPASFHCTDPDVEPLFPLPAFGAGANMAFRRSTLTRYGFDLGLGAGTPSRGGEDILIFTQLLLDGHTVRYVPAATTRHYHRDDHDGLVKQFYGYGTGLTAFYTALLAGRPMLAARLVRLAPRALATMRGSDGVRLATVGNDFPQDLLATHRRGVLLGPLLYMRSRVAARRVRRLRRSS